MDTRADVRVGVGGSLHDFSAAVWVDDGLVALVRAEDVIGRPHGVDVRAMHRLFDEESDARRGVGRWINEVRASGVVTAVVRTACESAGVDEDDVDVLGHSCPAVLLPTMPSARRTRVDHLAAHAAGVLEARDGDRVLVLDVLGDPAGDDRRSVGGAFEVSGHPRPLWTVCEPASVGVLLDGAALLNGIDALDRRTTELFATPSESPALAGTATADGYVLAGMRWETMVHRASRERFLHRVVGDTGPSARRRFADAAIGVCGRLSADLVGRLAAPGRTVWLAGDAFLHERLLDTAPPSSARRCRWPGDDGVAVGCASLSGL